MPGIREFVREEIPFLSKVVLTKKVTIDDTCIDAGNTGQTHILRAGLPVGEITATGKFAHYASGASDGTETGDYILLEQVDLKDGDPGATAADHVAHVLVIGSVVAGEVLLQDAALIADLTKAGGGLGWIEFV